MAQLEPIPLARCRLHGPDEAGTSNVRYIPLVDLELWKHFMETRHGRHVEVEAISVWVPEDPASWNSGFEPDELEPVLRVRLERAGPHGVPVTIERFFPAETYPVAQERLLAHVDVSQGPRTIVATPGYFVPEPAASRLGPAYLHH
ncbi:MAG TPA: hypothetical protein VKA01_07310 [Vicinamibacteria bacterium]|nr:hypothetical protein [Vicinamibacteria bacterium]